MTSTMDHEIIFEFEVRLLDSENIKILHTNIDLTELGVSYGDKLYATGLRKKIPGIALLVILNPYQVQVEKGKFFKWEDIESQLISEIKAWYKKQNVTSSKAVYTVSHDIPD